MKKRVKIVIARIMTALMVLSVLPLDMLGTANVVMAEELDETTAVSAGDEEAVVSPGDEAAAALPDGETVEVQSADAVVPAADANEDSQAVTYVLDPEVIGEMKDLTSNTPCGPSNYFTLVAGVTNKSASIQAFGNLTTNVTVGQDDEGNDIKQSVKCYENLNWGTYADETIDGATTVNSERTLAVKITGGTVKTNQDAVKITTSTANAKLVVYSSPKSGDAKIQVLNSKGTKAYVGGDNENPKVQKDTITIAEAGDYYIGFSSGGGIILYMQVTEDPDAQPDTSGSGSTGSGAQLTVEDDAPIEGVKTLGGVSFKDAAGEETVEVKNVVVKAEKLDANSNKLTEDIKNAVETAKQTIKDASLNSGEPVVAYYDFSIVGKDTADEQALQLGGGAIKLKLKYPEDQNIKKGNRILVVHEAEAAVEVSSSDKEDDGFWVTAKGFSPYTIIFEPAAETQEAVIDLLDWSGYEEGAYVEWPLVDSADGYIVYTSQNNSSWSAIDNELIRRYSDGKGGSYMRADALGLKAGTWYLKVEAATFDSTGKKTDTVAVQVVKVEVIAHDRSGYGFVNGTSSGAYNDDGTLKDNAKVIYVTNATKDTVSITLPNKDNKSTELTGVQNIITNLKNNKNVAPVCIRFIGNIEDPADMPKGDLYVDEVVCGLTLEGIGEDATCNGFGIVLKNCSNVELRNLGFMNCNSDEGDDVGLQQKNDHIWVHHCDFFYGDAGSDADQAKGDGALDTKTSTYVTHSYNHFWDNGKCNLQGMKSESVENYITYHHNWYDHSDSRHPRIRTCTVHSYNNYFDGNSKYGIGVTLGASAFSENNYFRNCKYPLLISMQGSDIYGGNGGTFSSENGGIIKSYGDIMIGEKRFVAYDSSENSIEFDAYVAKDRKETVPDSVTAKQGGSKYSNFDTEGSFYSYTPDDAEDVPAIVTAHAGRVNGGDFQWQFNNDVDDEDYDVNTALKAALVNYTSNLVSVGGVLGASVKIEYTVTFDPNNEKDATWTETVDANQPVAEPDISAKNITVPEGKKLGGWYNDSTKWNFSNGVKGDMTLKAKWIDENEEPEPDVGGDPGEYAHNFTENGTKSSFYTISGNLATNKGNAYYNSLTLTQCLKMESATSIKFTAPSDGKLILVFGLESDSAAGKGVKINDTKYTVGSDGTLTQAVSAGAVEITKGDTMHLFYMEYVPDSAAPDQYVITVDPDNGDATYKINVEKGSQITSEQLTTPAKTNYRFVRWEDEDGNAITLPYTPAKNMTIKAVWEWDGEGDEPQPNYNLKLVSKDIPVGKYTAPFAVNGFTINAADGEEQDVNVDDNGSAKKINNVSYTGRLKTGGVGNQNYRSIQFTTTAAATLDMGCVVATTDALVDLGVATLVNGTLVDITEGITVDGTSVSAIGLSGSAGNYVVVNLPEANTYYIYSKGNSAGNPEKCEGKAGVNFYFINVTYADGIDPVFYTVTFNAMGGLSVDSQQVQAGNVCAEPAGTLKSGYTFEGWYTDLACTQKYDFSTPVTKNITLYAKWTEGDPAGTYHVLDMKDLPTRDYKENFSKNGFDFKATSGKSVTVDASSVTVDGMSYTKRLKLNGTGSATERAISFTIEEDSTLTVVAASGSTGTPRDLTLTNGSDTKSLSGIDAAATFIEELGAGTWTLYSAKDGINIYFISVLPKGTTLKTYTITVDKADGSANAVTSFTVQEGVTVSKEQVPTPTRTGYTFVKWEDEDKNEVKIPFVPTRDMKITAVWTEGTVDPTPTPGPDDPTPNPPVSGDSWTVEMKETVYTYTGSAIKPDLTVYGYEGEPLVAGVDYTVKYSNNVNASHVEANGEYVLINAKKVPTVTITGKGNLTGKQTVNFEIRPADIGNATYGNIIIETGKKISTPVLYYNNVKLAAKDYDYKDLADKTMTRTDDDEVVLVGKGNFEKEITIPIQVVEKGQLKNSVGKFKVAVDSAQAKTLIYTGENLRDAIEDCITVTATKTPADVEFDESKYVITLPEEVTEAGTVKFTVVGVEEFSGCSVTKSVKILPKTLTDGDVTVASEDAEEGVQYTSTGATLSDLTVTWKNGEGMDLVNGKDYKVTYSANKKVGTAKYTISFMGNFKGKLTAGTFEVKQAALDGNDEENIKVVAADKVCKDNAACKSTPYVTVNGVLVKSSEYKVTYRVGDVGDFVASPKAVFGDEDHVTVYVKIESKGKNYAIAAEGQELIGEYTVWKKDAAKQDLSKARVTFYTEDEKGNQTKVTKLEYTGDPVMPDVVKVEIKNGNIWEEVEGCEIAYANNVNKGKATAIVTPGTSGLIGSKVASFTITAKNAGGLNAISLSSLIQSLFN